MPNAVEVASALQCDCGCSRFFRFGPYRDDASAWPGNAGTMRNDGPNPLQWFACDDVDHQEQAITTPIAEWFAKLFPDGDAPEPIVD
jgi:hypothetical protein